MDSFRVVKRKLLRQTQHQLGYPFIGQLVWLVAGFGLPDCRISQRHEQLPWHCPSDSLKAPISLSLGAILGLRVW